MSKDFWEGFRVGGLAAPIFSVGLLITSTYPRSWGMKRDTALLCLQAQKLGIQVTISKFDGPWKGERLWLWDETNKVSHPLTPDELRVVMVNRIGKSQ